MPFEWIWAIPDEISLMNAMNRTTRRGSNLLRISSRSSSESSDPNVKYSKRI